MFYSNQVLFKTALQGANLDVTIQPFFSRITKTALQLNTKIAIKK